MYDWMRKETYSESFMDGKEHLAMLVTNLRDIQLPDFIALDKDENVILIAKVTSEPHSFKNPDTRKYALLDLIDVLKFATKNIIPFAMLADKDNIEFLRWDGQNLSEPILTLNTADVLSHYEPKFKEKKLYNSYFIGLIESWLRDLGYNWNSETPPYLKEMQEIGFLQLIEGGMTKAYH
ncbi:hypothetical protein DSM106972_069180 [Dulcicalothrix desertica PCC 7102]|uniref:Type I restriction enzyme R protein N-terminal domain-containing protein n=2 Tax=Dulcicalothrix desertica TaxID=32056 RepID=A0A3S1C6W7_9CYAN|nr:hypothetical protein DSM106972_069180 [Dulcicalothrix desertica PCC 7102]TWH40486.1 hypothetical protein CAL7102_09823 [Dulcicalothrix desertica PCC 7102]